MQHSLLIFLMHTSQYYKKKFGILREDIFYWNLNVYNHYRGSIMLQNKWAWPNSLKIYGEYRGALYVTQLIFKRG